MSAVKQQKEHFRYLLTRSVDKMLIYVQYDMNKLTHSFSWGGELIIILSTDVVTTDKEPR